MQVRGIVVDLDGTVYLGSEPIPGAADAVARLRDRGLDVLFVTNNPTRTPDEYVEKLADHGIRAECEEILSAGVATAEYLADRHPGDAVFLVGSEGLRRQLREAGLELTDDPGAADVVVTSHDHEFDYEEMTEALWALEDAAAFYGSDPDLIYPGQGGRPYPGSGAITRAVAGVAEREPDQVLGKPSGPMIELISEAIGHPPEECLIVGDGLDTDVTTGERAGMTTVLVRSGRTTDADVDASDVTPDHVVDSLADVVDLVDRLEGN
jgi:4-nitrophenyl phosphatase